MPCALRRVLQRDGNASLARLRTLATDLRTRMLTLNAARTQAGDAADVVARLEPLLLTDAVKGGLVRLGGQHVRGLQLLQVCFWLTTR